MEHEFDVFPCTKNGNLKKGFCVRRCNAVDLLSTVAEWRQYSSLLGIKYYAFRLVGESSFCILEV